MLVGVGEEVDVGEDVEEGVLLLDRLLLPVFDGEAPIVREAVGLGERVPLGEFVVDEVIEPVGVALGVGVPVVVGVRV